jgi:nucleotide-binding universal stress UspA family protein
MYKQILCPIDGSPASNTAMNEAIRLAKDQNAKLRFLHAIDTFFPILDVSDDLNLIYIAEILRKNGKKLLKKAKEAARKEGVITDSKEVESFGNRVSKFVVKEAEEWPADLIVMGTQGLRGFEHLIMGSDAQTIIRNSHVPVMLIRNIASTK